MLAAQDPTHRAARQCRPPDDRLNRQPFASHAENGVVGFRSALNWRMVAAPAGLKADKKAELVETVEAMAKSKSWQDQLKAKGWTDTFLEGDAFEAQLKDDIAKTEAILKEIGLAK